MKVYTVIIEDRHFDQQVFVFSTAEKAIAYAQEAAREYCRHPEYLDERLSPAAQDAGWLYSATYSTEGDAVWVCACEIDEEAVEQQHKEERPT